MKNLTVLVDMDEVIVDTVKGFSNKWMEMFPEISPPHYEKLTTLTLEELYLPKHRDKVLKVWSSQRLFYELDPLEGAIEAIEEIRRRVKDIAICTSPPKRNQFAIQEKYEWVRDNLGSDWLKRLIITRDKTRIRGDILIDDKPEIRGAQIPSWEHVLYTHPWNKKIEHLRRLTWANWKDVLIELK
jgi:5'-nucleotidase